MKTWNPGIIMGDSVMIRFFGATLSHVGSSNLLDDAQ